MSMPPNCTPSSKSLGTLLETLESQKFCNCLSVPVALRKTKGKGNVNIGRMTKLGQKYTIQIPLHRVKSQMCLI